MQLMTETQIDRLARGRDGYAAEARTLAVRAEARGYWIELDGPAWRAFESRWADVPAPPDHRPPPPEPDLDGFLSRLPLDRLGDGVAAAIESFGGDRLARWYERTTGKPCGCPGRQERLNKIGAALKARLIGSDDQPDDYRSSGRRRPLER